MIHASRQSIIVVELIAEHVGPILWILCNVLGGGYIGAHFLASRHSKNKYLGYTFCFCWRIGEILTCFFYSNWVSLIIQKYIDENFKVAKTKKRNSNVDCAMKKHITRIKGCILHALNWKSHYGDSLYPPHVYPIVKERGVIVASGRIKL